MQLFILLALCWATVALDVTARDVQTDEDKTLVPRYTLLAESKRKDHDLALERQPNNAASSEQQPWRRLTTYTGYDSQQLAWPIPMPTVSIGPLLGPGVLLLGVNLGVLLYMLLGLLGLAPSHRIGALQAADIYRNGRKKDSDKETAMYSRFNT